MSVKCSGVFFGMMSQTPQTIYWEKADDEQIPNPPLIVQSDRTGAKCVSLAKLVVS